MTTSHPSLSLHNPPPYPRPHAAIGLSVGCFAGTGYGLAVGLGKLRPIGRKSAVVTPHASTPFAHDGALVGAFCGVMAGAGFATGIAVHIGYQWHIALTWVERAFSQLRRRRV